MKGRGNSREERTSRGVVWRAWRVLGVSARPSSVLSRRSEGSISLWAELPLASAARAPSPGRGCAMTETCYAKHPYHANVGGMMGMFSKSRQKRFL